MEIFNATQPTVQIPTEILTFNVQFYILNINTFNDVANLFIKIQSKNISIKLDI
ncbi:unnamed protein product [Paramecium octaurelia]|uniref:Uncharacterized protein n=1 Tax=Paramecium octaurelia TaxID=43137 RepID=A0A8S1SX76_PAROT|nr:unnamed protein product [Paramecium octaurelia]